jgi:hypothetical protein
VTHTTADRTSAVLKAACVLRQALNKNWEILELTVKCKHQQQRLEHATLCAGWQVFRERLLM